MKTKILIEKEWKYFFNLIGNEILVQLNQKTKEAEFVLPASYAVFGNNKERYKIENGDLIVSEKHKVYARQENYDSYIKLNLSSSILGGQTLIKDICANSLSPENIGQFFFNASAIYGASLQFNSIALGNRSMNSEESINSICDLIKLKNSSNSLLVNLVDTNNFSLCAVNSSKMKSGAINWNSFFLSFLINTSNTAPLLTNAEKTILKSSTRITYYFLFNNSLYLLASDQFNSSDILSACSCVRCDFATIFSTSRHLFNLSACAASPSLAASDQFTHENLLSSDITSSGIVITADAIQMTPFFFNSSNFFSSANLLSIPCFITSFQLTSGYSFLNLSSSFGADIVNVAIIIPLHSVSTQKDVSIYKPSDYIQENNYSLIPVTEAYDLVNSGNERRFLDESRKSIKAIGITKEEYSGKIFCILLPQYILSPVYYMQDMAVSTPFYLWESEKSEVTNNISFYWESSP